MKGSKRFVVGLLLVWGTVGSMDQATDIEVFCLSIVALLGLWSMYSGARALQQYQ